jgi:hypothetical protein
MYKILERALKEKGISLRYFAGEIFAFDRIKRRLYAPVKAGVSELIAVLQRIDIK